MKPQDEVNLNFWLLPLKLKAEAVLSII